MKNIGLTQWCIDKQGAESVMEAYELGLEAIQIQCYSPTSEHYIGLSKTIRRYEDAVARSSVKIVSIALTMFPFFDMFDGENQGLVRKLVGDSITAADQLGVNLIWLPSFGKSKIDSDSKLFMTERLFGYMLELCKKRGKTIKIASENTLSKEENLAMVGRIDHPHFQILIDIFNPVILGYNIEEYIDALWHVRADQIHIKDGVDEKETKGLNRGIGETELALNAIKAKGFDGYLILENDYTTDIRKRLKHDLTIIDKVSAVSRYSELLTNPKLKPI